MVKVIVSEFNRVEGNRYFDSESQTSFEIDHTTQVSRRMIQTGPARQ
jgi:capping protein alpha